MSRRWNKNDSTAAGYGAHQHPSMLFSHRRYMDRKEGKIPPLQYVPLSEVVI